MEYGGARVCTGTLEMLLWLEIGLHSEGCGLTRGLTAIASCRDGSNSGLCNGRPTDCILVLLWKNRGLYVIILLSQYLCKKTNNPKIGMHPKIPSKVVTVLVSSVVTGVGNVGFVQYFSSLLSEQSVAPSQICSDE